MIVLWREVVVILFHEVFVATRLQNITVLRLLGCTTCNIDEVIRHLIQLVERFVAVAFSFAVRRFALVS